MPAGCTGRTMPGRTVSTFCSTSTAGQMPSPGLLLGTRCSSESRNLHISMRKATYCGLTSPCRCRIGQSVANPSPRVSVVLQLWCFPDVFGVACNGSSSCERSCAIDVRRFEGYLFLNSGTNEREGKCSSSCSRSRCRCHRLLQ
jgi:hypothetical protein